MQEKRHIKIDHLKDQRITFSIDPRSRDCLQEWNYMCKVCAGYFIIRLPIHDGEVWRPALFHDCPSAFALVHGHDIA